ncbi:B12-binding domain-containing protein, partial [Myxococcota bacterium]|nr:B12-binding domain-containing protein [Myxococcota bacterium]
MTLFEETRISSEAMREYEERGGALVDAVNRSMALSPHLREYIGGNPLEVLYANHRHHHGVMVNVMKFNAWSMLDAIIPWVYRSYHAHGFSWSYFPAVYGAWSDALRSLLSPASAAELTAIYDTYAQGHDRYIAASSARTEHAPEFGEPFGGMGEKIIGLLISGDASGVIDLGAQYINDSRGLASFYLDALTPAMVEIGLRWEAGRISVAHEHLASGVVNRVMSYWYHHVLDAKNTRGKALVTSGPGEFHSIGGAMFSDLLTIDGWQTIHLGANTPISDLLTLADSFIPDIVAISVAMPFNIHA